MRIRQSMCSYVVLLVLASGCGSRHGPERAPPNRAVRTDVVDYDAINPGAIPISVAAITDDFPKTPLALKTPGLKRQELLVVRGSVQVPKVAGGLIRVEFTSPGKGGRPTLVQEHMEPVKPQDDGKTLVYETQLRGPAAPGEYDLSVYLMIPGVQPDGQMGFTKQPIAAGRSVVR